MRQSYVLRQSSLLLFTSGEGGSRSAESTWALVYMSAGGEEELVKGGRGTVGGGGRGAGFALYDHG